MGSFEAKQSKSKISCLGTFKNSDTVKQILIGERVLGSGNWNLENDYCQHKLSSKEKKRIDKHLMWVF
jgi:hypothetical protein